MSNNNINNNPNLDALATFPSADDFNNQVDAKQLAIKADDESAADRWLASTVMPAVFAAIARTTARHRPQGVTVPFKGTELAGHDAGTMQVYIKKFLSDKKYTDIDFQGETLTFTVPQK